MPPETGSSIWYMPLYEYKEDVDGQEGMAMEGRRRQNKEQRRRVAECATIGEGIGIEKIKMWKQPETFRWRHSGGKRIHS